MQSMKCSCKLRNVAAEYEMQEKGKVRNAFLVFYLKNKKEGKDDYSGMNDGSGNIS